MDERTQAPSTELEEFLAQQAFLLPNLNDTFAYASADTEQITVGDGEVMAWFWRRHGWHGLIAVAAMKRGRDPIEPVASHPNYRGAKKELEAGEPVGDEGWTLQDEFELR